MNHELAFDFVKGIEKLDRSSFVQEGLTESASIPVQKVRAVK